MTNVKNNDKSKDIHSFFAQKASQPLQKKNTKSFEENRADNRLKDAVPRRATVLKKISQSTGMKHIKQGGHGYIFT